jgi:hypothetical protein
MTETKYGKHIITDLIHDIPHYKGYSFLSHEGELDEDCSIGYHCISEPITFEKPHAHDFTELLCFFGGDPTDIRELGAEVEVCLGEEQEKHLLTKAGVVSIPAGLMHCPIEVKNVTKPIVFLEISLTRLYGQTAAREDVE